MVSLDRALLRVGRLERREPAQVLLRHPAGDEGLLTAEPRLLKDGRTLLVAEVCVGHVHRDGLAPAQLRELRALALERLRLRDEVRLVSVKTRKAQ